MIDASHVGAAAAAQPRLEQGDQRFLHAGSGLVVFGASTGTEVAREDAKWDRHGAFTKALIEAIAEGKASLDKSGQITTDMLALYLEGHVKAMTDGTQHPVMNRPSLVPDFPFALARP